MVWDGASRPDRRPPHGHHRPSESGLAYRLDLHLRRMGCYPGDTLRRRCLSDNRRARHSVPVAALLEILRNLRLTRYAKISEEAITPKSFDNMLGLQVRPIAANIMPENLPHESVLTSSIHHYSGWYPRALPFSIFCGFASRVLALSSLVDLSKNTIVEFLPSSPPQCSWQWHRARIVRTQAHLSAVSRPPLQQSHARPHVREHKWYTLRRHAPTKKGIRVPHRSTSSAIAVNLLRRCFSFMLNFLRTHPRVFLIVVLSNNMYVEPNNMYVE